MRKNNFFIGKKNRNEKHLSSHTGSSDVRCFDLYLINIFTKSRKVERCTDGMFKLDFYCLSVTIEDLNLYRRYRYEDINILGTRYLVLLDATLGTR